MTEPYMFLLNPVHSHFDSLPKFVTYYYVLNWMGELEAVKNLMTSPGQITKWYYFNKWKTIRK